jgi:hypothetical protein
LPGEDEIDTLGLYAFLCSGTIIILLLITFGIISVKTLWQDCHIQIEGISVNNHSLYSYTGELTDSVVYSLSHSLTHSLALLTHSLAHLFIHPFYYSYASLTDMH